MTQMLQLSGKDSKTAFAKLFQQAIMNSLKMNGKTKTPRKKIRRQKEEPNKNLELENAINESEKNTGWDQ